ncbi:hypothetical protein [Paenibacillus aestuarii]|uniref:hypothetical protein n=1 Tax=Paenibacillus aestuarii TaxID=516965 RepID=UPI0022E9CF1E|nr:hypothetical protein [Paenibacillus aestuarii]
MNSGRGFVAVTLETTLIPAGQRGRPLSAESPWPLNPSAPTYPLAGKNSHDPRPGQYSNTASYTKRW